MEEKKYVCQCRTCGESFPSDSTWRKYCNHCRKLRRLERVREYRRKHHIYKCEKILYQGHENLEEEIKLARLKKLYQRRDDIDCPNYNPTRVDCAVCSSDSWKYKSCGGE